MLFRYITRSTKQVHARVSLFCSYRPYSLLLKPCPETTPLCTRQGFRRIQRLPVANTTTSFPINAKRMASSGTTGMTQVFTPDSLPPIGHYSQAIKANGLVWTCGLVPVTPDGKMVEGSVADKARQTCRNAQAVLKAAGSGTEKAVKVTIFFRDLDDFGEFNSVYADFFPQKPARTSAQSDRLPLGAAFEMDIVALE